jgi:hypothetical protein
LGRGYLLYLWGQSVLLGRASLLGRGFRLYRLYRQGLSDLLGQLDLLGQWLQTTRKRSRSNPSKYWTKQGL